MRRYRLSDNIYTIPGFPGALNLPSLVAFFKLCFDLLFALTFSPFFFDKKTCGESRRTSFCVKASGLGIPWSLTVHEAGKSVAAFADLYIPAALQDVHRGLTRDFIWRSTLGKLDSGLARQRKIICRLRHFVFRNRVKTWQER